MINSRDTGRPSLNFNRSRILQRRQSLICGRTFHGEADFLLSQPRRDGAALRADDRQPIFSGKGSGRTIDSRHCRLPCFRQKVTLLTDAIDNCFAIHRLLTVVSRRNPRALLTFPTSPSRRRPKSASSQSSFASCSAMIRRAFSSADWPISLPDSSAHTRTRSASSHCRSHRRSKISSGH